MAIGWYLAPYKARKGSLARRYCAMNDFTAQIDDAGGYWSEAEIDGDRALVKVRAPDNLHTDLRLTFPEVLNPSSLWTPRRTVMRADKGGIVPSAFTAESKPLEVVEKEVLDDAALDDVKRLRDSYIAAAEKDGYVRLPADMDAVVKNTILVMAAKAGYCLDRVSPGTFPTTGVLDVFTGTNGADLPTYSANWSAIALVTNMEIQANAATGTVGGALNGNFWNVANYGANAEVYATINTKQGVGETTSLMLRAQGEASILTLDGYIIDFVNVSGAANDTLEKYRIDDSGVTLLGSTTTQEVSNGDSIGLEMIGNSLQMYYKAGAGAWATAGAAAADNTYASAGKLAIVTDSSTVRIDGFGGGTVVAAGVVIPIIYTRRRFASL